MLVSIINDPGKSSLTVNREDKALILKHGRQRAFLTGHNSTCRYHLRGHWDVYKAACGKASLALHHHAMPRNIWEALVNREKAKDNEKKKGQQTLSLTKITGPKEFTRGGILHAVAQFVVCDDQVRSH
jgi:hypothetical protein